MKKKDIIILTYKIIKFIENEQNGEPDWENIKKIKMSFVEEVDWTQKTFIKSEIISLEKMGNETVLCNPQGEYVIKMKFKKLFNLIYK
jgi:hypothetical protein